MNQVKSEEQTLRYVKIFALIVLVAAVISIGYKIISLISSSSFKTGTFNTLIIGKNVWFVHYDPVKNRISTVEIEGARSSFLNKNVIVQSANIGVLVDGQVVMGPNDTYKKPSDYFIKPQYKYRNLNDFDVVKMMYYTKAVPPDRQILKRIAMPKALPVLKNGDLLKSYGDDSILNEEKSVEIINSTDIDGFGTRVGNSLKSIGLNVVKIDSDNNKKSQILSSDPESISTKRLGKSLDLPVSDKAPGVSDVTIILGKDIFD